MRRKISLGIKILSIITSITAVVMGCILFERDGYSAWYKRLYYFTNMSNVWIACVMALALWVGFAKRAKHKRIARAVYVCKYIFTVSIAITGIIFCALLAPFAEDGYNPWSFNSILAHVVTPLLSIVDFFVDDFHLVLGKRHLFATVIPPLVYFVFALIMGACGVDFGQGETYPYFFMDFNSPVGLFGFSFAPPRPAMGAVYWIIVFCLLVLSLAWVFKKFSPSKDVYQE